MSERETPPGPASVSPAEPPVYEEGLRVPADPVVSPADTREAIERAEEWVGEFRDTWDWPRDPITREVDAAAAWTTLDEAVTLAEEMTALAAALLAVGERDEQLLRKLRALAAIAKVERERDRRQIARLTEALRFYADKSKWNYRIGGKQPRATYVSYRLAEEALRDVAVLADEEDAGE